jgi:hypothetical protein
MNLPPLVNLRICTSAFVNYKGFLTFISDVGNVMGASCFSIGSILSYGVMYGYTPQSCGLMSCALFRNIITVIACFLFTIAPAATFILCDAIAFHDKELSWNISIYIIGGIFYMLGALTYLPLVNIQLNLSDM